MIQTCRTPRMEVKPRSLYLLNLRPVCMKTFTESPDHKSLIHPSSIYLSAMFPRVPESDVMAGCYEPKGEQMMRGYENQLGYRSTIRVAEAGDPSSIPG